MRFFISLLALILSFVGLTNTGYAAPDAAPDILRVWEPWIMDRHKNHGCSYLALGKQNSICAWPGKLVMKLDNSGGRFEQTWQVEKTSQILLPSTKNIWPANVTINNLRAIVLQNKNAEPYIELSTGEHKVVGRFKWNSLPQQLSLPLGTVLMDLNVNGKEVVKPSIKNGHELWLQQTELREQGERDMVRIEVFRVLTDDVPRRIQTQVRLSISGKPRELYTGQLLLPNTVTEHFESELPARIEKDGRLRMQIRSGEWEVLHQARVDGNINSFLNIARDEFWPKQELWAFVPNTELRSIKIEGPDLFDVSEIDVPEIFSNGSVYLMDGVRNLELIEQARGDQKPQANALYLNRKIWLDFDGDGATLEDKIAGKMHQDWRLEVAPNLKLGRVTEDGEPRIINQVAREGATPGFEIRFSDVDVNTLARVESNDLIPANGWLTDFSRINHQLVLPPGWRVWHVGGPDQVRGTWVSKWNLWDIFLCLIIVGALYKVLGIVPAVTGFAACVLTYHLSDNVISYVLPLVISLALLKVLPQGKFFRVVRAASAFILLACTFSLIAFSTKQLRSVVYLQLEDQYEWGGYRSQPIQNFALPEQKAAARIAPSSADSEIAEEVIVMGLRSSPSKRSEKKRYDVTEAAQMGPGMPDWNWKNVNYSWSGPVKENEQLALYTSGPVVTRFVKIIEVIFSALVLVFLVRNFVTFLHFGKQAKSNQFDDKNLNVNATLLCLGFIFALTSAPEKSIANTFPSQELLSEYEKRLLEPPECGLNCYFINDGKITLKEGWLAIELTVSAGADIAAPLPTSDRWRPTAISVNDKPVSVLKLIGSHHHLPLGKGNHKLRMEGKINDELFNLSLPSQSRGVVVDAPNWSVSGLRQGNIASRSIVFEKRDKSSIADRLLPDPAEPFVKVYREFVMGVDWYIHTLVERVAPRQGAIEINFPLLKGERILDDELQYKDGSVKIVLDATKNTYSFDSEIDAIYPLVLAHAKTNNWSEEWSVRSTERWNLFYEGLLPNKNVVDGEFEWSPWPGESVTLYLTRPDAVKGNTTSVENVNVDIKPGKRAVSGRLETLIRTSIGGDYTFDLPSEFAIKLLTLNEQAINENFKEGKLSVRLQPGENRIVLRWEVPQGIQTVETLPELIFDGELRNIRIQYAVPRDRWLLWASGPVLGPALLFWSMMLVVVILAVIIGRLCKMYAPSIPVSTLQWLLLGVGVSTVTMPGGAIILAWFVANDLRARYANSLSHAWFNFVQVVLIILTILAGLMLFSAIPNGLLSTPNMHVSGAGSYSYNLNWYADYSASAVPQIKVISVSLWFYRFIMLLWSVWLVFSLMSWCKWGWQCFSSEGLWRKKEPKQVKNIASPPTEGARSEN